MSGSTLTFLAFLNDKKVKAKYLGRVKAHSKADEIVKGRYWQNGKGCAVGCTIHSSDHKDYEIELGIPEWLARVEDRLFEGMPDKDAKKWPAQFLSAIKVGANLEKVKGPFLLVVLVSALKTAKKRKNVRAQNVIKEVIRLWKKYPNGAEGNESVIAEFRKARSYAAYAADAAADAAAAAAADAAAADAARLVNRGLFKLLTEEIDMRRGLKVVQVPGRYGYSVTLVGWVDQVAGDEYVMLPGHYSVTRTSGRATLDELASRGPGDDHRLYGPHKMPEELHRLTVRRPKPMNEKAWLKLCPKPDDWDEK